MVDCHHNATKSGIWHNTIARCLGYLHVEADPDGNILWFWILPRKSSAVWENVEAPWWHAFGSHFMLSQHVLSLLLNKVQKLAWHLCVVDWLNCSGSYCRAVTYLLTHSHTCRLVDGTSMKRGVRSGRCGSTAGWPPSLRREIFNVRRRRAPSSHVSNETYSEPNGTEDPRRLVSTAVTWRVSRKCLKRLASSVSPGFGSEFSFS